MKNDPYIRIIFCCLIIVSMIGCSAFKQNMSSDAQASIIVLKNVDIYFADAKFTEDVTFDRDKQEMLVHGLKLHCSGELIDEMLVAEKRGNSQCYVFVGDDEVVKMGFHPKGAEPIEI